jgi:cytochrome c-type biogenesis protein CcmH/NrfG
LFAVSGLNLVSDFGLYVRGALQQKPEAKNSEPKVCRLVLVLNEPFRLIFTRFTEQSSRFWIRLMTHTSAKLQLLIMTIGVLVVLSLAGSRAQAQVAPRSPGTKPAEKPATPNKPNIIKRVRHDRPRPDVGSVAEESDRFLDLGDRFYDKGKLNAAEVAYKEALRIWPRNADAVYGLGSVYSTKGDEHEAQAQLNRLRSMDSELANALALEMKRAN